jgi:hypothetical protein
MRTVNYYDPDCRESRITKIPNCKTIHRACVTPHGIYLSVEMVDEPHAVVYQSHADGKIVVALAMQGEPGGIGYSRAHRRVVCTMQPGT